MLNFKKEAKTLEVGELKVATCPVCSSCISHVYFMQDSKTKIQSKWFSCSCGVVFQDKFPTAVYDKAYWDKYEHVDKKLKDSYEYPIRLYAPIIEELMYGRRVLLIGQTTTHQADYFKERGWVPTVIDKNPASKADIIADFEEHKFLESQKFNMIWLYQTLECFRDPIASLELCKKLLVEDGILFIGSPSTDFINTRGSSGFIHWKPEYNHIMWNKRSITRHLDYLGFETILCRNNYEHRFAYWDDFHGIFQRRFF